MIKLYIFIFLTSMSLALPMEKNWVQEKSAILEYKNIIHLLKPPHELCVDIEKKQEEIKKCTSLNMPYNIITLVDKSFVVKANKPDRAINALRLKNCIENCKLTCLDVPTKYIYEINGYFIVFAEYIEKKPLGVITLKEIKQLVKLVDYTRFSDFGLLYIPTHNIIRRKKDNKLVFIDTENAAFGNAFGKTCHSRQDFLDNLSEQTEKFLTKKATVWLQKYKENFKINRLVLNKNKKDFKENSIIFFAHKELNNVNVFNNIITI